MSDGARKNDSEGSKVVEQVLKRAGRARVCTQCKFTTTDVKEFSNHRIHAHAEEKPEEKSGRRNSTRRKASLIEEVESVEPSTNTERTVTVNNNDVVTDERNDNEIVTLNDSDAVTVGSSDKLDKKLVNETKKIDQNTEQMAEEQKISDEYLSSLSLKKSDDSTIKQETVDLQIKQDTVDAIKLKEIVNKEKDIQNDSINKRPDVEKTVLEKLNGHTEEVLLVNRDDDQDDEPRLIIADDGLNDIDELDHSDGLDLSGDHSSLTRSGNIQNRTYLCNVCEYSTTSAKSFLHHQKGFHHLDLIIYECDICEYATKYKQKLPRHRKLHFTGKDGMSESDMDSSLTEKELREMKEMGGLSGLHGVMGMTGMSTVDASLPVVNGDDDMEDDGDIDEEEDEDTLAARYVLNLNGPIATNSSASLVC